jgi:homoserine dehydrogenase
VEGYDACRKIAILTSLAYGKQVDFEDLYCEGITKITKNDFKYADKLKRAIKLLATSHKEGDKVYAFVAPFMIKDTHPLFNVNDVINGVYVKGNMVGDLMFIGAGAGKLPTASAVVGDIIECVKNRGTFVLMDWSSEKLPLGDINTSKRAFFARISGSVSEKLAEVEKALGKVEVVQADGLTDEFGIVTDEMSEKEFEAGAANVSGLITRIRLQA